MGEVKFKSEINIFNYFGLFNIFTFPENEFVCVFFPFREIFLVFQSDRLLLPHATYVFLAALWSVIDAADFFPSILTVFCLRILKIRELNNFSYLKSRQNLLSPRRSSTRRSSFSLSSRYLSFSRTLSSRPECLIFTSTPPRRVPPRPPPKRRGNHPFTVRARSTSTNTRLPSIFLPSACL